MLAATELQQQTAPNMTVSESDVLERMRTARVPQRFVGCTLVGYKPQTGAQEAAHEFSRQYSGSPWSVLLYGPAGAGKTHLAVAMARAVRAERGKWFRFVAASALLDDIRQAIDTGTDRDDYYGSRLGYYANRQYLVLDDLGVEKSTEWAFEQWYRLINERYERELPTIITTNLHPKQLQSRYDDRIASRLCDGAVLKLDGPDWRIRGK